MTIQENHAASPKLRPERADADKRVIGDEVRGAAVSAPVRSHATRLIATKRVKVSRRPLMTAVTALGTLTLVVVVIAALGVAGPGAGHTPRGARDVAPKHLGKWQLVSDVSPTWTALPNSAYEPGIGLPKGLDLTCPTVSTCFAVKLGASGYGGTNQIVVTNDGGTTWNPVTLPVTLASSGKPSLTCGGAATCENPGDDASAQRRSSRTSDGGQTWTTEAGPSGLTTSFSTQISCVTQMNCVAVSGGGTVPRSSTTQIASNPQAFATSNGGVNWTQDPLPRGFLPQGLQCTSADDCVASGVTIGVSYGTMPKSQGDWFLPRTTEQVGRRRP